MTMYSFCKLKFKKIQLKPESFYPKLYLPIARKGGTAQNRTLGHYGKADRNGRELASEFSDLLSSNLYLMPPDALNTVQSPQLPRSGHWTCGGSREES